MPGQLLSLRFGKNWWTLNLSIGWLMIISSYFLISPSFSAKTRCLILLKGIPIISVATLSKLASPVPEISILSGIWIPFNGPLPSIATIHLKKDLNLVLTTGPLHMMIMNSIRIRNTSPQIFHAKRNFCNYMYF